MNQIEQTTQWLDEFAVKVRQFSGDDPELWGEVLEEEATSLFAKLVGKAGVEALKEGAKLRVQHSGLSFIHGEYETVRCVPLEAKNG